MVAAKEFETKLESIETKEELTLLYDNDLPLLKKLSIKRIKEHLLERFNTSVYKHHIKSKLTPIFTQLTDYIDVNEASILEGIKLKEYIEKGFNTLNKIKCGGVGWCKYN